MLNKPIVAVHYVLAFAGSIVEVAPYATYGTGELAAHCVRTLAGRNAVLLRNHGVITVGESVGAVLNVAQVVEYTAELLWRALAVGEPTVLDEQEMRRWPRSSPPMANLSDATASTYLNRVIEMIAKTSTTPRRAGPTRSRPPRVLPMSLSSCWTTSALRRSDATARISQRPKSTRSRPVVFSTLTSTRLRFVRRRDRP